VVEVVLAAAVALHRIEAQLERRDVLRAVGAADRRVHRTLDRERARLDQLGPVVDLVEGVERVDAARVGDRDEPVELPVVLHRERDPLLVGEGPEDVGGDRAAEVRV
jgi:D-serine deaminase-like pyridoxal phosphate-dependent protein